MSSPWPNVYVKMESALLRSINPTCPKEGCAKNQGTTRTFKVSGVTLTHNETPSKLTMAKTFNGQKFGNNPFAAYFPSRVAYIFFFFSEDNAFR